MRHLVAEKADQMQTPPEVLRLADDSTDDLVGRDDLVVDGAIDPRQIRPRRAARTQNETSELTIPRAPRREPHIRPTDPNETRRGVP